MSDAVGVLGRMVIVASDVGGCGEDVCSAGGCPLDEEAGTPAARPEAVTGGTTTLDGLLVIGFSKQILFGEGGPDIGGEG